MRMTEADLAALQRKGRTIREQSAAKPKAASIEVARPQFSYATQYPMRIVGLPYPISVNAAFVNIPGRGRARSKAYKAWAKEAEAAIHRSEWKLMRGPVEVHIFVARRNARADLDNLAKCILDLLVKTGLIQDDRFIESILMRWVRPGDADYGTGATVVVLPCAKPTTPEPKARKRKAAA